MLCYSTGVAPTQIHLLSIANCGRDGVEEMEIERVLFCLLQVRRLKKDILKQLPPKQRLLVEVPVQDDGARFELQEGVVARMC